MSESVWHEPIKTLNGVALTVGQAMTLRVALSGFDMSLAAEGLGDDEHGIAMTKAYRARVQDLWKIINARQEEG